MRENFTRFDERQLQRRVQGMIQRGVITNVDDAMMMQILDLDVHKGYAPTKVEHWHPYGISYHPMKGSEVLALSLGGHQDHMIILPAADRRFRLKNLAPGEFAIHDDQGQKVHFLRDKTIVESPKPVHVKSEQSTTVEAPTINLKGNVVIEGNVTHTGNYNQTGVHIDSNGPHTA